MENENLDLDVKPAGNKDLWLFLIIVDIILLCVFGFYLYKHFSASLFQAPADRAEEVVVEQEEQPQAQALPVAEEVISIAAEPVAEPVKPLVVPQAEETLVAQVVAAEEKPAAQAQAPAEQKQSVVVAANPKSKYRRVTFRWYGECKTVQIVSGFTMSKPQALKKKGEYWETTLSILPGTYKFLYIIDGENRQDPYSPAKDGRSVVVIE